MRVGILGGTFDPPHVGHLLVASDAFEALHLDRIYFIPNARQPLKTADAQSSPEDRMTMVRLATASDRRFVLEALEVERGGLSFTVDTIETLATRDPGHERFLLLGTDASRTFAQWRSPGRIAALATLALMRRSGATASEPSDADVVGQIVAATGPSVPPPVVVATRRVDVSSTEVRERVRTGLPLTGFVPEAVGRFIFDRGLYHTRQA